MHLVQIQLLEIVLSRNAERKIVKTIGGDLAISKISNNKIIIHLAEEVVWDILVQVSIFRKNYVKSKMSFCSFFLSDYQSTPNWSHQNQFRGQHWNLGGTPRGGRGNGRGFTPRGNFRGRGGHQNDQNRSYFHPSMLEDPWANLVKKNDLNESIASEEHNQSLSDSLRPQFGDSMINPAPDVPENLDDTNDLSKYSYTSDQGLDESRMNLNEESITEENDQNDTLEGKPNLSDSMIPLVGESILERNEEDI